MTRLEALKSRKPARRVAEVPRDVLRALEAGELESISLVEFLAIDTAKLLVRVAEDVGLGAKKRELAARFAPQREAGVMKRLEGAGRALFDVAPKGRERERIFERLAAHPSDLARQFAAFWLQADERFGLAERLERSRRFATDPHSGVREIAWMTMRPYLARELELGLERLEPWVRDLDANVRRAASEATRPRGVWCAHLERLKREPELAADLLEPLRSDPSRYVQNSVANWINDASKSRADWAKSICVRWKRESNSAETAYIVKRALRTIAAK